MGKIISKISKKWQLVIYITLMTGACVFFVSTLITPKYQTQTTFLILQNDVDIASAAQSAEFLSEVFVQVAFSEPFIDAVLESPYKIEKDFSFEPVKKKKQWKKDVIVESVGKAGVLKITVLDESRLESRKVAQAIAHSFAENGSEYYGGRGTIELKPIDGPTTSDSPVSPNIFLNTLWGLFVGLTVSILLAVFSESFNLKLFGRSNLVGELVGDQLRRQLAKRQERKELMYEHELKEAAKTQIEEVIESEEEDELAEEETVKPEYPSPFAEEKEEAYLPKEQEISQRDLPIETFEDDQASQIKKEELEEEAENKDEAVDEEDQFRSVFIPVEKKTLETPMIPKTEISQEPDFAGSMISEDEFRKGVLAKKEITGKDSLDTDEHTLVGNQKNQSAKQVKEIFLDKPDVASINKAEDKDSLSFVEDDENEKEQQEQENVETGKTSKRESFLSRLYGKSLFADKKISKIKEARTVHEREFPDFEHDEYFPQIERAKNFSLQEIQKEEVKTEKSKIVPEKEVKKNNLLNSKRATAPAPENLPVFMSKEETQEQDTFVPKEFSPIEHIAETEDVFAEKLNVEKKEAKQDKRSFEEMVLSGELKDASSNNQNDNQVEIERAEEDELEKKANPDKEPTEEEVKERLNRLLKGEL